AFSEALYEFNVRAGEAFAPWQGGAYAGAAVAELVGFLRAAGVAGGGPSSGGAAGVGLVEGGGGGGGVGGGRGRRLGGGGGGGSGWGRAEVLVAGARNGGALTAGAGSEKGKPGEASPGLPWLS